MQITPSELSGATNAGSTIDSKLLLQIKNFENRPLLLEKLVVNQSQGLLLKLTTNQSKLEIQLPLSLARIFDNTSNQPKITLTVNRNNQIQLSLNGLVNKKEQNTTKQAGLNQTNLGNTVIIFNKAIQLSPQVIKLDAFKQTLVLGQDSQIINSAENYKNGQINNKATLTNNLNSNPNSSPNQSLNKAMQNPNTTTQTNYNPPKTNTLLSNSILKNLVERLKSKIDPASSPLSKTNIAKQSNERSLNLNHSFANNSISNKPVPVNAGVSDAVSASSVASVAKQLLNNHFSQQRPIQQNLSNIFKQANNILTSDVMKENNNLPITKLFAQLKRLYNAIEKIPNLNSTELKERIKNSGQFLEKNIIVNAKQQATNQLAAQTKLATQTKSEILPLTTSNSEQKSFVDKSNLINQSNLNSKTDQPNSSLIEKDLKLQLLLLKKTIEKLIKPSIQLKSEPDARITNPQTNSESRISQPTNSQTANSQTAQPYSPQRNDQNSFSKLAHQSQLNILNKAQLSAILKPANEILVEVKNAIAQIETNQLHSLRSEQPNLHQFLVDLPFGNKAEIDSFELLFENSSLDNNQKNKKRWKVVVRFDLEPLGPMFARIELENDKISTHIFAESKQTANLIEQNLHVLKKSLFDAGVDINKVQSTQGHIPDRLVKNSDYTVDTHV